MPQALAVLFALYFAQVQDPSATHLQPLSLPDKVLHVISVAAERGLDEEDVVLRIATQNLVQEPATLVEAFCRHHRYESLDA